MEKELGLLVVGSGDMVHLNLADGNRDHASCDVDLRDANRSHRGDNGDAQG